MQSEGATIKAWLTSFWGGKLKFPWAAANWISLHTHKHRGTERGRDAGDAMFEHHLWEDAHAHKAKGYTHRHQQRKQKAHMNGNIVWTRRN